MHATLAQFKTSPLIPLLLLPLTSAASGLNIVEANHLILVEPSLSPGKELQAVGRIVRIGQQRPTFVHRFLITNSVEERIFALNAAQREAAHKAEGRAAGSDGRHNDEEDDAEEEGDVLLGARGQGEDALDARDFANLLGDDDDDEAKEQEEQKQGDMTMHDGEVQPTSEVDGTTADEATQEQQEERDLQQGIRASRQDAGPSATATAASSAIMPDVVVDLSSGSSALAPSESAALSSIASEAAALAAQHRFWTSVVLMRMEGSDGGSGGGGGGGGGRRMTRLQALTTLQRLAVLDPPRNNWEAKEDDRRKDGEPFAALINFHGKWLSPLIAQQLQQFPLADASI
jgi:hypothetical protein